MVQAEREMGRIPVAMGGPWGSAKNLNSHAVPFAKRVQWASLNAKTFRAELLRQPPPEYIVPSATVFIRKFPSHVSTDYFDLMRLWKNSGSKDNRLSGMDDSGMPGPAGGYYGLLNGTAAECFYYNFVKQNMTSTGLQKMLMPSMAAIEILKNNPNLPYGTAESVPSHLPNMGNYKANLLFTRTMKDEHAIDFNVNSFENKVWNEKISDRLSKILAEVGYGSIMEALLDPEDCGLGRILAKQLYLQGADLIYTTSARANIHPDTLDPTQAQNLVILGEDFQPITDKLLGTAIVEHRVDDKGKDTSTVATFDRTKEPERALVLATPSQSTDES